MEIANQISEDSIKEFYDNINEIIKKANPDIEENLKVVNDTFVLLNNYEEYLSIVNQQPCLTVSNFTNSL